MVRNAAFVTFFLGGLFPEAEHVTWITDDDEFTANQARMRDVTRTLVFYREVNMPLFNGQALFQSVSAPENSRHNLMFEDLCAIPDLTAGMLADALTNMYREHEVTIGSQVDMDASSMKPKANQLLAWYCTKEQPLKRIACVFVHDPDPNIRFQVHTILDPEGTVVEDVTSDRHLTT